jgi:hypothetical protein
MGTLTGNAELAGDVCHWSTQADDPFDQKQPSPDVQACITVRHETSRCCEDFETSPLSQEVSPFHKGSSVTNVPAEYS